ncbi:pneumococcal-type histidine triad protein [Streptococcus halichoeri]|uniref:pneumococcal-type histidine triad protein n=1 Tax=Streptococcus halichoeri TaxID=254785 RepID=UPI00135C827E|nr:pneumococcal-type histidine triad protein [Streptococcus halichoeri]
MNKTSQHKRLLYLAGVLLSCNLALTACWSPNQKQNTQEPKKHQKVSKAKKTKQKKSTKKSSRKEVAGIDKPTDDGFLLTSESQIEGKTDLGIIVKHGDHQHFFFYSDLKGTKWAYLIPKDYKEGPKASYAQSHHSNAHAGFGQTGDGYVFNPKDIVAEDANGYTVRHGDHYHYILKSSLGVPTLQQIASSNRHIPAAPPTLYRKGGIPGIDFKTSDGFLFDGKNISGTTATGILVKHGQHYHPISFEELKHSKWSHLVDRYKPNKPAAKPAANADEADYQAKRAYLAKELHIDPSQITKVVTDGQVGLEYPHEDHKHVVLLKDLDIHKPFETPEDHILRQEKGESFEQRKERLIKEYMEHFKVKREDITVDGNYMSVRHGDHAHVYKIDPNLPDDPERDVKTETTNLEAEDQLVYGPLYSPNSTENLSRNGVYAKYKPAGIKNIKNFVLLTFNTNSHDGDLLVNGQKTKRVYYLVRKDLDWSTLKIQRPQTITHDGRIFKGWSEDLPTSGIMARENKGYYADFSKELNKPTKEVYGPNDNTKDIDLSNYVPIRYTTLANGKLRLGDKLQGGFIYFVNPELTWRQAKIKGLVLPTPVPNAGYEFIDWRTTSIGDDGDDSKVSVTSSLAAFGSTAPFLGPYQAKNPANPTDKQDPSRHRNYYWHNPDHYVAVAFKVDGDGQLVSSAGRGKTLVYLVRKGMSLTQAGILAPAYQGQNGAKFDSSASSKIDYSAPVNQDTTYTFTFKKTVDKPAAKKGETVKPAAPAEPANKAAKADEAKAADKPKAAETSPSKAPAAQSPAAPGDSPLKPGVPQVTEPAGDAKEEEGDYPTFEDLAGGPVDIDLSKIDPNNPFFS